MSNNSWYEQDTVEKYNNTNNHEWYTPPQIFKALNTEFDLDVATIKNGLPWIPAKYHYHKDLDGLKQKWFGFVWCNPPYGNQTKLWLEKFYKHNNGIALIFSRTDTSWFHEIAVNCDVMVFTKGRIKFYKGNENSIPKKPKNGSTGSLFLGCGEKAIKILENANLGYMVKKQ